MDKTLTLIVSIEDMKVIGEALQNVPFKFAAPVIYSLKQQVDIQLNPQPASEKN